MSWWRRGVIYEIYPRSFQDSDGDGGFTTGEPWLPCGDLRINAEGPNPMLELHRRLIALGGSSSRRRTRRCTRPTAYSPMPAARGRRWRST